MVKIMMTKEKISNTFKNLFIKIRPSLIAVGIGLFLGLIVMFIFNPAEAIPGLGNMLAGGLTIGIKGLGDIIAKATIIILTGLALVVAFKSGLFNIGAPGQMIIGGYVAAHIGVLWTLPSPLHWIIAVILGALAGAIWGMIPGLLKAYANTNEVVSSIMLNYVATFLAVLLVYRNIYNSLYSKSLPIKFSAQLPKFSFLFPGSIANIGFLIAIAAVIIIHILFNKFTLGYELKAAGFNPDASKYAGMNSKRNIVLAMAISGLLAGLAGAIKYLEVGTHLDTKYVILTEGFDGISVALLGLNEPLGALIAGFFLSYIRQGGLYMQGNGFSQQIIDIIISVIVYTTSIAAGIQLYLSHIKEKRGLRKKEKAGDEA